MTITRIKPNWYVGKTDRLGKPLVFFGESKLVIWGKYERWLADEPSIVVRKML